MRGSVSPTGFIGPKRKVSRLVGRRLTEERFYAELTPDAQGRVYSQQLGLFFSIDADSEELVMVDAETGQRLRISDEEEQRAEEEAAARQRAEAEVDSRASFATSLR